MQVDPLVLGIVLVILGLVFSILLVFSRANPPKQPHNQNPARPPIPLDISPHTEAHLLVQSGGRVLEIDPRAREWFKVWEQLPNLERLGRRAHPNDTFLAVCAAAGTARFSLDGRVVEATSYDIPYGVDRAILVTMRRPQLIVEGNQAEEGGANSSSQAFTIFSELSQTMTASLDLETTLKAILQSVQRLIPADLYEVKVWEPGEQLLVPYRIAGLADTNPELEKGTPLAAGGNGLASRLITQRQPVLMANLQAERGDLGSNFPYQAYLGSPLEANDVPVGTLELASLEQDGFTENDLEVLRILSGQAGVALHNARLYGQEQRRALELGGLANLAQVAATAGEPQSLFGRLVDSIGPLLKVELVGFLIYDEARRVLRGEAPFYGMPDPILIWASYPIATDSLAEKIWNSQEILLSEDAPGDERLRALGLDHLAQASGIKNLGLIPLTTSGHMLGYLLVGDRLDGSALDALDLRLLTIIAAQVAPIIENATLVQQSRRRAQRAETLRRIASLSASSATADEILKFSLQDLARLLKADLAGVFLLDESRGELRVHLESLFGIDAESAAHLGRLSIDDPQFRLTVTGSKKPFLSDDLFEDTRVLPIYRQIVSNLQVRSSIVVPLAVRERGIGEMMLGSRTPNSFNRGDLQSVLTAAGQMAGVIERANLYSQTDESLRRRVEQLTAVARISRELNSTLELPRLLERVYDEVLHTTQADCGTILLFDLSQERETPEEPPGVLLYLGDPPVPGLHPVERLVLAGERSVIIEDFEQAGDEIQAVPVHPGVRSAMVVPIAYQEQVAGLIHLHTRRPQGFDAASREIAETLAIQAAIALGNAHLYQEQVRRGELLNRRVETLARLFETSQSLQLELPLDQALENMVYAIQAATPFDTVLISVYDPLTECLQRVSAAGISLGDMQELRAHPQAWNTVQQVLQPDYRIGRSYFIPYEKMPVMPAELHTITVLPLNGSDAVEERAEHTWHPEDVLVVPLLNGKGQPLGLVSVDAPRDNLRPDRPTIESLEIFASQAALVIESQQKLKQLNSCVDGLQNDLVVSTRAAQAAQTHLPTLLHKDLEQTLAIQRLSQRARRIQAGIDIAEIINRQGERAGVLQALGRELITRMGLEIALVVEPGARGPHLLNTLGAIPPGVNVEALIGQRNPLHHCLQSGENILVSRLDAESEWASAPLLQALKARAFICLTVLTGSAPDSAVLAVSQTPLPVFSEDDEQLYSLLARQVGITLQNLTLLTETSQRLGEVNLLLDFNRRLGSLEPARILETLVESVRHVVPAAEASLVAMWDTHLGVLAPRAALGYGDDGRMLEITYHPGEALPGQVFQRAQPYRLDEVDFAHHYSLSAENLLRYRDATGGRLPVSSLVVPVQQNPSSQPLGVLVLDNFQTPAAFTAEALALASSLAQQTALHLENTRLYRASQERASQLQALTRAAAAISSKLQPDALVETLLDQVKEILPYDTGTLWLRQERQAIVRAARGFADDDERVGLATAVEDSALLSEMINTRQPISIGDVSADERFPSLVEAQYLSWLGVPLVASGEVIGVIALEKSEPEFYTTEYVQIASTFSSQAAVALENARLYQESLSRTQQLDQRTQRLEMLNRLSSELSESLDSTRILDITLNELSQAITCAHVSAIEFDERGQARLQAERPQSSNQLPDYLPDAPLFERLRQTLGVFISESVEREPELAPLADYLQRCATRSLLVLPLAAGNDLHGLLLAHTDRPYRFSTDEVGLARTIANQAAIAIQNARLYAQTRSLTEDLEQRVQERTAELEREHQRTETLLHISTELATSLDLEQVLNRTLNLLNQIVDAGQITVLIARPGERKLHRLASIGYADPVSRGGHPTPFNIDEGLAGWVLTRREPALIADVLQDPRWILLSDVPNPQHRSALSVPLLVGAEALGVLLLYHQSVGYFSKDQLDLVQAAANQVAVAINNAELYRLIRDQAEDLGSLFRSQQVEASRSLAILEAVADGVLVTDAERHITLFNASAQEILGLEREQVIGKTLEQFMGLFGRAAQDWQETIQTWSQDPSTARAAELYSEQITLEDGRVVSVHLSPATLRDTFLGTVSVFRDITHEVELDRLKSEFVATVSHELRTPMTSIKGYVDILLMGAAGQLSEQQTQFLDIVKSNTERLAVLVNDLLDISRIEAGRVSLSMQPLNLEEIAGEAVEALRQRSQADDKPMIFEVHAEGVLPMAYGDLERVRQVLDNLLENAYYYSAANGKILVNIHLEKDELQVDIQDNGIGIAPEMQPRVFERFYRGEHPYVLATSGTGLGLSIVQHLVEMHGGRIWFASHGIPGDGSVFSFTLPPYKL